MSKIPLLPNPKLKDYIIKHWNEYRPKTLIDIKKDLSEMCEIPSEKDMNTFQTWFNNKKKLEKKKIKKNNESEESKTNNNVLPQADLAN